MFKLTIVLSYKLFSDSRLTILNVLQSALNATCEVSLHKRTSARYDRDSVIPETNLRPTAQAVVDQARVSAALSGETYAEKLSREP
jgi:hypothetical protein